MSNFEVLKTCIINNRRAAEEEQAEQENPTGECPKCAWTLQENENGQKSCPMCGRIWG